MAAKTSIAKTITKLYYSSGSHSSHPKHLAPLSLSSSFSSSSPNAASPAAESQSTISSQAADYQKAREDVNENVNPKDVNTLIRSSVMPQDHLNYTLTWYSLSAARTFMALIRLKPKKSRR